MICDTTRCLVEWLADTSYDGEQPIKGKSKPQKVWRLNSVRKGAGASTPRSAETPVRISVATTNWRSYATRSVVRASGFK
jgi:hypothetical protein